MDDLGARKQISKKNNTVPRAKDARTKYHHAYVFEGVSVHMALVDALHILEHTLQSPLAYHPIV